MSSNHHHRVQSARFSRFDIPEAVFRFKNRIYDFIVKFYDNVIATGERNRDQQPCFSRMTMLGYFFGKFKTRMVSLRNECSNSIHNKNYDNKTD